jgi:RHH-type rel operon transcriptional repressor/antitoxin RelB
MLKIFLPKSIETRLAKFAKRTGHSKTFYVREAILRHLENLEDIFLAERCLQRIRTGKDRTISLADVVKRHGL